MSDYKIKHTRSYHGHCPPGYFFVSGYTKEDGTSVEGHCRKITVRGRTKTAVHGVYNEARIAGEDAFLFGDTITDRTSHAEKEAEKISRRSQSIAEKMRDQESKKREVREKED